MWKRYDYFTCYSRYIQMHEKAILVHEKYRLVQFLKQNLQNKKMLQNYTVSKQSY